MGSVRSREINLNGSTSMKKPRKRIPVPKKPPKVEVPKKAYSRKREKERLRQAMKGVDNNQ